MAFRELLNEASDRTSGHLTLILLSLSFLAFLVWSLISHRRLAHIPGPPIAAWTSWWWFFKATSTRGHEVLAEISIKYGSLARIMPNTVLTDDLQFYRKMNSASKESSSYTKGPWYAAFKLDAERENLFTERNEERHARVRQQLAPGYSGKDNQDLEPSIDELIMETVRLIQRKYLSHGSEYRPMDFAAIAQQLTLDVITYLGLGKPFGFISEDEDKYGYIKSMEDNFPLMNVFATIPVLSDIMRVPTVQNNLIPSTKDKTGIGKAKA
jgi:cytochrome P450